MNLLDKTNKQIKTAKAKIIFTVEFFCELWEIGHFSVAEMFHFLQLKLS